MDSKEMAKILRDKANWDYDEAKRIIAIDDTINVFVNLTTGQTYLREVEDTVIQAFRNAVRSGPLAAEPMRGVKVILHDTVIHEDPAHRGPAQLYPAVRSAVFVGFLTSKPSMLEPIQKLDIRVPMDYIGNVTSIITKKRGKILDMSQAGTVSKILAEIPVSETFDLASELRGATAGRAIWGTEFSRWGFVPDSLLTDLIMKIRERKGLPKKLPQPEDFVE
jgi:Translation elongation factors (GTPases)